MAMMDRTCMPSYRKGYRDFTELWALTALHISSEWSGALVVCVAEPTDIDCEDGNRAVMDNWTYHAAIRLHWTENAM